MDRYRQDIVVVFELAFIEVIADARPVSEQLLDRHSIVDEGQVVAE